MPGFSFATRNGNEFLPFTPLKLRFAFRTASLHLFPVFALRLHLPLTLRPFTRRVTTTPTVAGFDSVSFSFVPAFAVNEAAAKRAFKMTGGAAILAVFRDLAAVEPPAFVAVTTTRSLWPT